MFSLTIITGWLGSGKTTLLNRILSGDHGMRIAVVQNEFGQIGVDGDLVIGADFGLYELSNGCLCCGVKDDFLAVVEDLAAMEDPPDHVLVEASGVADPSATVLAILGHPDYGDAFVLDGVVALVDALNVATQLDECAEVEAQIAFADLLLLNKIDLVDASVAAKAERLIGAINPEASIARVANAVTGVRGLLDIGGFDLSRIRVNETGTGARLRHSGIAAYSFRIPYELDFARLDEWIGALLRDCGESLYRMKGILHVAGTTRKLVLQGVRSLYDWRYGDEWSPGEEGRIVFIGRDLDRTRLAAGLQRSVVGEGRLFIEP